MIFSAILYDIFMKAARLGGIRYQLREAIAAVDIRHHGDRTNAMRGIKISVAIYGMLGSPFRL